MIYLSHFTLPRQTRREILLDELVNNRTCYSNFYPFQVFDNWEEETFSFEPITVLYGGNGSGKTTLAARLAEVYDCNVFHMDDFFLRPEQRTPERYSQIGGNVDYERFHEEVLLPLTSGHDFSYRPFDCKTLTFCAPVKVTQKKLNIIEGTYSHHPYFGNPYDLKFLLSVDAETQRQRECQAHGRGRAQLPELRPGNGAVVEHHDGCQHA